MQIKNQKMHESLKKQFMKIQTTHFKTIDFSETNSNHHLPQSNRFFSSSPTKLTHLKFNQQTPQNTTQYIQQTQAQQQSQQQATQQSQQQQPQTMRTNKTGITAALTEKTNSYKNLISKKSNYNLTRFITPPPPLQTTPLAKPNKIGGFSPLLHHTPPHIMLQGHYNTTTTEDENDEEYTSNEISGEDGYNEG